MFKSMRADAPGCVWAVREPVLFRSVLHDRETGVALTMPLIPTPFHTAWDRACAERIYLCRTDERDVIANDHARSDRNQPWIRDIQLFEFNSALPHFA